MHSFRSRILVLIIGLVVGTQIVTLVSVSARIADDVQARAVEQLDAASSVVSQMLTVRTGQLANAVSVLASDFGFRSAVSSGDRETIISAMDNQIARVHADLALVLDPDGQMLASTGIRGAIDSPAVARMMELRVASREKPTFVTLGGRPCQIVVVPVRAPQLVAWVAMGFAVDDSLAREVRKLINLEVAFVVGDGDGAKIVGTSLPAFSLGAKPSGSPRNHSAATRALALAGEDWLSMLRPLDPDDRSLNVVLLTRAAVVMKPYTEARTAMLIIGGTALLIAILVGIVLGRSATQPVVELDSAANRIREGNYQEAVTLNGAVEFQRLAHTFNGMQQGIADREQQLSHLAYHDAGTGLPNLRKAELEIDSPDTAPAFRLAVIAIEISALNDIRATLGDAFLETALRGVTQRLREQLRENTFIARIGPNTFLVLLRAEVAAQATRIASRMCEAVRRGLEIEQVRVVLDGVAGVALAPEHGRGSADLIRRSLIAMRSAAQRDEMVVLYSAGSEKQFRRRLDLSAALPQAIESGALTMHYQPKLDLGSRRVVGAEALVRWSHPQFGNVSPAEFVPLAESTGSIRLLTRFVLREGIRELAAWRAQGLQLDLSVNISAADIVDGELAPMLLADLRRNGVPASSLILEITETAVMRDRMTAARHMELLRVAGIRFSIDDFGTGHSSLSLLRTLPVDELKIDRQFIMDVDTNDDSAKIVQSTIQLARALELKVVAEGIEADSVMHVLERFGCHSAQGFHICKPAPSADFLAFVARTNAATPAHSDDQQELAGESGADDLLRQSAG